ncbi:MAG: hypothetical protein CMQ54_00275 [Gammaproteobacteria bacterium]|nr:hypothetical protein [Gammaproteobacteria bacterium]|tara:strand:- start:8026 stop:8922 length:897 start_codon:yes stop_codon:yes gene_type:complete
MKRIFYIVIFLVISNSVFGEDQHFNSLIRVPDSVEIFFVAETSTSKIHQFSNVDGNLTIIKSFYMSIGKKGPGKQRSGDKRTPLGLYFVTEQLDTSKLHEKYGATAYVLDYPNFWDKQLKRTGSGIWLHGVDPNGGQRPKYDTDGCIAMENDDLRSLQGSIKSNLTPVLVTRNLFNNTLKNKQALRLELESAVSSWALNKSSKDIHTYLSLHRIDSDHSDFNESENSLFSIKSNELSKNKMVKIEDLLLLAYPEEDDLYLSRFRLVIGDFNQNINIVVELYWHRKENGSLEVIAENTV